MDMMTAVPNKTRLKIADIVRMANVAEKLSKDELDWYGKMAVQGYLIDEQSREEWKERNAKAVKLALQVVEQKSFPWTGASNVKFPLVTIAALQFLARVSILTKGRQIARLEPWGNDATGKKAQRADRISTHLSYQLLEQDRGWLDDDEIAKFSASILGCAIKNTWYDSIEGINRSQYVPLMDFVVDYYCKDLNTAQRVTLRRDMFANKILENVRQGYFLEMYDDSQPAYTGLNSQNSLKQASDEVSGLAQQAQDGIRPYEILEQHTWLDLDDDGYAEPYVIYVRLDTAQTLRIVARYYDVGDVYRKNDHMVRQHESAAREAQDNPEIASYHEKEADRHDKANSNAVVRITPTNSFTKYTFIPSPDGGFYGLGLGALLGPTNAAVDTLINQIIDSGTMLTTSGGFLGRGVKIKSGKQSFDPFEWKPVDGVGDDLRKNIVPLPVNAPPEILFHLLGLLIGYGEKIGSATDIMTGVSPGQNTPAETSRNTLEQGMMLFSGIYTRMHRAFGEELRKFFNLNRLFFQQSPTFQELTDGEGALVAPDDYTDRSFRVSPAADATASSPQQKQNKAKAVFEIATAKPNGFNQYLVVKQFLEALDVEGIDELFPDPKGPNAIPPIPNPKVELEKAKLQIKEKELQQNQQEHQDDMMLAVAGMKQQIRLEEAKIEELGAKAEKELAEAKGVETGHQIAIIEAQMGAAKAHKEGLQKLLDSVLKAHHDHESRKLESKKLGATNGGADKPGNVGRVVKELGNAGL